MARVRLDPARSIDGLEGLTLGVVDTPRVEWDAVDLRYRGHGIEVKSAAYLQSWAQTKPSTITFDVARKRGWDRAGDYERLSGRIASVSALM